LPLPDQYLDPQQTTDDSTEGPHPKQSSHKYTEQKRDHIWNNSRGTEEHISEELHLSNCEGEETVVLEGVEADVFIHGRDRSSKLDVKNMSKFNLGGLVMDQKANAEDDEWSVVGMGGGLGLGSKGKGKDVV
jgi:hypothetical protein